MVGSSGVLSSWRAWALFWRALRETVCPCARGATSGDFSRCLFDSQRARGDGAYFRGVKYALTRANAREGRGDWLMDGKRHYGDGLYKRAAEILGLQEQTLRLHASMAIQFELLMRINNLSYAHHREVASIKLIAEDKKGELWIAREKLRSHYYRDGTNDPSWARYCEDIGSEDNQAKIE